jgi:predicted N-acetyltransferase YhbS
MRTTTRRVAAAAPAKRNVKAKKKPAPHVQKRTAPRTRIAAAAVRRDHSPVALIPARAGDHVSIFHLLQSVFHAPSATEFQAAHDDPLYEPGDRLLARRGQRLLGHVQIVKRTMRIGSQPTPVAWLAHLSVLPEFRRQTIGTQLLRAAEQKCRDEGAQITFVRTNTPELFARHGWVVCGRHCYSLASARSILAYLTQLASRPDVEPSLLAARQPPLNIRLWRQVEQDALCRLYDEATAGISGPLLRNHAYWRWLVSRHAYDRIYVALRGDHKLEWDECAARIVGYAVARDGHIIELVAAPGQHQAALQLLGRACSDAVERDEQLVRIDAPPRDPLHRVVVTAGGQQVIREVDGGELFMAKAFDPLAMLEALRGDLFVRAKSADLAVPNELGLVVGESRRQIVLTRRSAKLVEGKTGRSYLQCSPAALTRLLLGHARVADEHASGRLVASTRVALETAGILFPQQSLWYPPLDYLPAA